MQDSDTCPKCGKAKKQAGSGSLTQWISACSCDQIDSDGSQIESINLCSDCGKRKGSSRSGSFTQWIFRQDLCDCKSTAIEIPSTHTQNSIPSNSVEETDSDSLEELQVEEFPSDRYLPFRLLGKGALSEIYLSKDRLLDKLVAVKVMRSLSPEQIIAFQKEAKATSALSHASIVKVLDFGASSSGTPYMVLEYVDGQRLDVFLGNHGALTWYQALTVLIQLCAALSVAHANGIYHRDIKPGNVLIETGADSPIKAKLIDFGIATIRSKDETSREILSEISGTPAYMSPEQASGKYSGAPSEVFSLGCVLYECLTAKQLFEVIDTMAALVNRAQKYSEEELNLDVIDAPDSVKTILKTSLAKDPADRFQTAEEFQTAAKNILEEHEEILDENNHAGAEHKSLDDTITDTKENSSMPASSPAQTTMSPGFSSRFKLWHGVFVFGLIALGSLAIFQTSKTDEKSSSKDPQKNEKAKESIFSKESFDEMQKTATDPKINEEINLSGEATTDESLIGLELRNIKLLKLTGASITDVGLMTVSKIKTLESLYLNKVKLITIEGLEHLTKLKNLTYLNLNATRFGNEALPIVSKIKSLKVLRLMDLKLTEEALAPLIDHPNLMDIDVNRSKIKDGVGVLRNVKTLEIIRVGTNGVTDNGVKALDGLPNLKALHIQGNPITGAGLRTISTWPVLQDLWIIETNVRPEDLSVLKKTKTLQILRVDGLKINDISISYITGLKQIKHLTIGDNQITDKGLLKLASMPNLESVDVKGCRGISLAGIGKLLKIKPNLVVRNENNGRMIELKRSDFRFLQLR